MPEDVEGVLSKYFAIVFTKEKDMEISVGYTNMVGQFEIKKEMILSLEEHYNGYVSRT